VLFLRSVGQTISIFAGVCIGMGIMDPATYAHLVMAGIGMGLIGLGLSIFSALK
jgi:hypothetical protein